MECAVEVYKICWAAQEERRYNQHNNLILKPVLQNNQK
jgi:hypothetical protein